MILILGSDSFEQGTDPVIDWLIASNASFLKITLDDLFKKYAPLRIDVNQGKIYYNDRCLNDEVQVVWYRHFDQKKQFVSKQEHQFSMQLNDELNSEIATFNRYFFESLKDKKWVSPLSNIQVNKLLMLNKAASKGLKVPESRILNTKDAVSAFLQECSNRLIIKQFSDVSRNYYLFEEKAYVSLVKGISNEDALKLPTQFFPTLFQERLDTDFEIRVFYVDGQFFATAIVSENGYNVDDRKKFANDKNVHHLPYELPAEMKNKLSSFMKEEGLLMGGIDLVKCQDGKYYFLEVNPIGQYLFESNKCNFHIPKAIAEYLIKEDQKTPYETDQRHCL